MRYLVKQKIFSIGDKFSIRDVDQNDIFLVQSQIFSFGKKLRLYDLIGNELCYIEQKLFKLMPEYNIYMGGRLIANVKKRFAFLKNDFIVTSPEDHYFVEGDFWAHEFRILKDSEIVANISKQYFSFADTYTVDVDDRHDQISILALAIVVDMVCHDRDK